MLKKKEPKKKCVDWLSTFGLTKDYGLFLIRSERTIEELARDLSVAFQSDFSYMGEYEHANKHFPMFFTRLTFENDACWSLMPNKIMVNPNAAEENPDPLLGLFLFEDEFFVFNKGGRHLYDCEFQNYDYIFLLMCENDTPLDDLLYPLSQLSEVKYVNISELVAIPKNKRDEERTRFTKNLFVFNEKKISEFEEKKINDFLKNPLETIKENWMMAKFMMNYELTSKLAERKDV